MTRTARLPLISDYPAHYASHRPISEALVLDGERTTYEAFSSRVDRCARALHHAGVGRGDRVATLSTPRPDYLVLFMATARIGGIWLGLNPRSRFDELEYIVGDAAPRILFAIAGFEERDYRGDLARLMQALAEAQLELGGFAEAEPAARRAVAILEATLRAGHPELAAAEALHARALDGTR